MQYSTSAAPCRSPRNGATGRHGVVAPHPPPPPPSVPSLLNPSVEPLRAARHARGVADLLALHRAHTRGRGGWAAGQPRRAAANTGVGRLLPSRRPSGGAPAPAARPSPVATPLAVVPLASGRPTELTAFPRGTRGPLVPAAAGGERRKLFHGRLNHVAANRHIIPPGPGAGHLGNHHGAKRKRAVRAAGGTVDQFRPGGAAPLRQNQRYRPRLVKDRSRLPWSRWGEGGGCRAQFLPRHGCCAARAILATQCPQRGKERRSIPRRQGRRRPRQPRWPQRPPPKQKRGTGGHEPCW